MCTLVTHHYITYYNDIFTLPNELIKLDPSREKIDWFLRKCNFKIEILPKFKLLNK